MRGGATCLVRRSDTRQPSIDTLRFELERFLRGGTFPSRRFAAGTAIVREHELGDTAYIITAGRCEAFKIEAGRKIVLREMGPGDLFGELAILTSQPRTAGVVALDDVTVLTVTHDALAEWLALDSWTATLVRSLADRFRDLDSQAVQLRHDHLKLVVRERLITAVAARGQTRWSPLCAALRAETGLAELDLLAIAADSDDLALDPGGDVLRLVRG